MKKFICFLFGHKANLDLMIHNHIEHCLRCEDMRDNVYNFGLDYWTDLEYHGLIKYPFVKIKYFFIDKYYKVKDYIRNKNREKFDDVPF